MLAQKLNLYFYMLTLSISTVAYISPCTHIYQKVAAYLTSMMCSTLSSPGTTENRILEKPQTTTYRVLCCALSPLSKQALLSAMRTILCSPRFPKTSLRAILAVPFSIKTFRTDLLPPVLCSLEEAERCIMQTGIQLNIPSVCIKRMIATLETPLIEGCTRTLATSIDKFISIPGFSYLVQRLCSHCYYPQQHINAKGIMNEARVALMLAQEGHEIVGFGVICNNREYDIVTTTHFVECKNISNINKRWAGQKLRIQVCRGIENARMANKRYMWASKRPFAEGNVTDLPKFLLTAGADVVQG